LIPQQKVEKVFLSSYRRKSVSNFIKQLDFFWTPVFTGVTTFYNGILIDNKKNNPTNPTNQTVTIIPQLSQQ